MVLCADRWPKLSHWCVSQGRTAAAIALVLEKGCLASKFCFPKGSNSWIKDVFWLQESLHLPLCYRKGKAMSSDGLEGRSERHSFFFFRSQATDAARSWCFLSKQRITCLITRSSSEVVDWFGLKPIGFNSLRVAFFLAWPLSLKQLCTGSRAMQSWTVFALDTKSRKVSKRTVEKSIKKDLFFLPKFWALHVHSKGDYIQSRWEICPSDQAGGRVQWWAALYSYSTAWILNSLSSGIPFSNLK